MHIKETQRLANTILDTITDRAQMSLVATIGFKGELPEGLTEDDKFELLNAIQDTAKCIDAGACRHEFAG